MTDARFDVPAHWRSNPQTYDYLRSVHSLVEERARVAPDTLALQFLGRETTYRSLERRANALATRLRAHGAGPGTTVALCMTHAVESVAGMLAILKSGAAYVPMDPTHPPERLKFMAADARCGLALAQSWTCDLLDGTGLPVLLCDDAPDEEPGDVPNTPGNTLITPNTVSPNDVAYILYTSGSTGDPKGVVVEHGGVVNRLLWDQQMFPTRPGDRILHHTSLGFDISIWEILAPLAAGACLVLTPPADLRDPMSLLHLIDSASVTVIGLTPSLLRALLDAGLDKQTGRSLRYVFCGGEALPTELARRTADSAGVQVFNFYGPTEATIDATFWCFRPDEHTPVAPIGRPIGNCTVQVLDVEGTPAGIGTPGELLVGGPGLARGYTAGVTATDRVFITVTDRGTARRMYRTGDLVAWRDDGALDYLGRLDDQVKIRGHRIEPTEVEAALTAVDGVAEAAVLASDGPEKTLLAFITAQPGHALSAVEVRNRASRTLPPYMVPSRVQIVDTIPRDANGKRDRRALLDSVWPARTASQEPIGETPTSQLASLVGRILGTGAPDPKADFFDLGGSSLGAARLIALVRRELHTDVTLRDFLSEPSVAHLADLVIRGRVEAAEKDR
ncbi:non-ribosomal peptide synthetase [Streptomyces sp. NPDC058011]|uniref:non-ribosomal peptide synthetase n=1 Tax=Streptomyces sp. NPDC058011 TaxID=3346305 RepID=UPI0036F0C2B4